MVNMQERMMSIYLNQDYESFIQRNSSEYVAAVSGYVRRYKDVLQSMLKIFSDVLVCIAVISALAVVSIETLSILIFLFLTMFLLFNKFLYSKVLRYGEEFNLGNRLMIKGISEGVSGIKEIRVLGKEDFFKTSFSRGIKTMAEMEIKQSLIQITPKSLLELLDFIHRVVKYILLMKKKNVIINIARIYGILVFLKKN